VNRGNTYLLLRSFGFVPAKGTYRDIAISEGNRRRNTGRDMGRPRVDQC
jgi:hypothetical protein